MQSPFGVCFRACSPVNVCRVAHVCMARRFLRHVHRGLSAMNTGLRASRAEPIDIGITCRLLRVLGVPNFPSGYVSETSMWPRKKSSRFHLSASSLRFSRPRRSPATCGAVRPTSVPRQRRPVSWHSFLLARRASVPSDAGRCPAQMARECSARLLNAGNRRSGIAPKITCAEDQ